MRIRSIGTLFGVFALAVLIIAQSHASHTASAMSGMQGTMIGTNMNLTITPSSFNPTTDSNVTLAFMPNPDVPTLLTGGVIKHLDYNITVSQGGNLIFNYKFHTHSGNLSLVFTSSSGQFSVTGGQSDAAHTTTGPFYISGPAFNSSGNYEIAADIVGVNFSPVIPLEDKFTLQAVPEFGQLATIVLAVAVISIVVLTARTGAIQKLWV